MKASLGMGIVLVALSGLIYVVTGDRFLPVMSILLIFTAIGLLGIIGGMLIVRMMDEELVK